MEECVMKGGAVKIPPLPPKAVEAWALAVLFRVMPIIGNFETHNFKDMIVVGEITNGVSSRENEERKWKQPV